MTAHDDRDLGSRMTHDLSEDAKACPFCAIIAGEAPADIVGNWGDALAITPLNPVTDGHVLVIPSVHVADAAEEPNVTALVMRYAAKYAREHYDDLNIITSVGASATQTVRHLHVHLVPRKHGDGLALPWSHS